MEKPYPVRPQLPRIRTLNNNMDERRTDPRFYVWSSYQQSLLKVHKKESLCPNMGYFRIKAM